MKRILLHDLLLMTSVPLRSFWLSRDWIWRTLTVNSKNYKKGGKAIFRILDKKKAKKLRRALAEKP